MSAMFGYSLSAYTNLHTTPCSTYPYVWRLLEEVWRPGYHVECAWFGSAGVKRGDECAQLAQMMHHRLGVRVSAWTVRRYIKWYLGRHMMPRKHLSLAIKHVRTRICFAVQRVRMSWYIVVVNKSMFSWFSNKRAMEQGFDAFRE